MWHLKAVLRRPPFHLRSRFRCCGEPGRRGWLYPVNWQWKQLTLFTLVTTFILVYQFMINIHAKVEESDPLDTYRERKTQTRKFLHAIGMVSKRELPPDNILRRRGPPTHDVSCSALFRDDQAEVAKAQEYMSSYPTTSIENQDYTELTKDCQRFRDLRGYIMKPQSQEEKDFPIAFSILMYKHVEQVERLLRAIYMPQNFYCIHLDAKASDSMLQAMKGIVSCFPNVFIASRSERVFWGHISILNAEVSCLTDLMKYQWKYYINLSGQMFPLQSNRNLVKILKLYNGANDVEGTVMRSRHWNMVLRQAVSWMLIEYNGWLLLTPFLKSPPPHNLTMYKGSNQVAVTKEFVHYALYSEEGRDLYEWLKDTYAPDEYFLPTLNHNAQLKAPGGYTGDAESKIFTARASIWEKRHGQINWSWEERECEGKWVHGICILGVGDLPWTFNRPELFLNKVHLDYEPLTLDCLEELIHNRTMAGENYQFIPTYYNNLDIVKHRELVNLKNRTSS